MRVLVTGANGFLGSNLCADLARDSALDVVGLVRPTSDLTFLNEIERLTTVVGDITRPESLVPAMEGVSIVYHVAGYSSDWGPWEAFRAGNVDGVRNVMTCAREKGVRRVVHISSVSVYGFPGGADIEEDTPFTPRPNDRYITTKAEGERVALKFNGHGLETAVVRPGGVFGPNDRTTTLQLAPVLTGGKFGHVDGGVHLMAPAYVDNVVQIIRLAGEAPNAPGQAFNAVDDGRTTWRQFIDWMCEDLACPSPRLSAPGALVFSAAAAVEAGARLLGAKKSPLINKYRVRAVMRDSHYSSAKAKRMLGYRPKVATREGVRRAVAWYRAYDGESEARGGRL
ncbi:MAG: NAD-dependent epimerase/dehydratase family protein [Parvularculaceae bacterium]